MTNAILSLIGNTPLMRLSGFDTGPCDLYIKLENRNPGGSIKDRVALSMIEQGEADGSIKPGCTLIEATAGNTGIGLSLVAICKGYKIKLVVPDKMSVEKISLLKAMGAEVILTRSDVGKGHPEYYQDKAEQLARCLKNAFYINQFSNPANPLAHETTTGPEIFKQLDGKVDAVVCGIGSGGTATGLKRYFKKVLPDCEIVIADPEGSIMAPYILTGKIPERIGSWFAEGIGEDFIPQLLDLSGITKAYAISDRDSYAAAQELLRSNAVLGGSSTGTLLAAALKYCREQKTAKRVVTFACDSGDRYLSKVYSQSFMLGEGLLRREKLGDLRDFVFCTFKDGSTVFVRPSDSINSAFSRMKMFNISQLPVLENNKVVGIIDESDILDHILPSLDNFSSPVASCMSKEPLILQPEDSLDKLLGILRQNMVGILAEGDNFYGVITRTDMVNALKLQQS